MTHSKNESCDCKFGVTDTGYDLQKLYRHTYTTSDNPNTVIEPTTRCNLSCPGCYRRTRLAFRKERDMSLEEVKQYIDDVARLRNTSCISFLGGEPLLYDQIDEAIAYARQQGFSAGLYTNGLLLDKQRLKGLKDAGISYILVHVDKHQERGETEEEINQIRKHFCDMFREEKDIPFGFAFQLTESDIPDIPKMVECFIKNVDVVKIVGFSLCTNSTPEETKRTYEEKRKSEITMCKAVQDAYGLEWSAYLGNKYDNNVPGKIFAECAFHDGELVSSIDSGTFAKNIAHFYEVHGKYPYMDRTGESSTGNISGKIVTWQRVGISFTPLLKKEGLNFCDNCTDAVLHKGRFVPMCILEYDISSGGTYDWLGAM